MKTELYQIYHVARCGSTLLTALLSNCEKTYSEPSWAHDLNGVTSIPDTLDQYNGSIVKFSSITTSVGFKPPGPKVFLYRPLAQYLYKMNTCESQWIDNRKQLYGEWFSQIQGTELVIEPETIMQLHTIFWASCVLEMQKYENVLWIESNDLFADKEGTAKKVLRHFGKDEIPEMRFAHVNVKSLKLNGQCHIQPFENYNIIDYASETYGITESSIVLNNQQIKDTIEWAKVHIPVDTILYV